MNTVEIKQQLALKHAQSLEAEGKFDEAILFYQKSIEPLQARVEDYYQQGCDLEKKGSLIHAIAFYQTAIQKKSDFYLAHNNLGNILQKLHQFETASDFYRRAIQYKPDLYIAHNNLGTALLKQGKLSEAICSYQKAIELNPADAETYNNIGNAFKEMGDLKRAISSFQKALRLKPDFQQAHSNLLLTLNYEADIDPLYLLKEHQRWAEQYAHPFLKSILPHTTNRDPNRPLRIGYLSPDFRRHAIAYFITPILAAHDKNNFEIFCYANNLKQDEITQSLKKLATHWRIITSLSDEDTASQIRSDCIDILVDLSGHTAGNRILVFARKPAPIQISYLGYPTTTGLKTIDYRLTDHYADPPGTTENHYVEKLIRLPHCTWCYQPSKPILPVSNSPVSITNQITFACFNNFAKIGPQVISCWSEILKSLPYSILMLLILDGENQIHIYELFEANGIKPDQLRLIGRKSPQQYLELYQKVDIALDPFPCNGGTTTCDALWMGVPVVTLSGNTFVSRAGTTILNNLGMTSLIAKTKRQYIQIATQLASNRTQLMDLRLSLREKMQHSPLMDSAGFTQHLESAYREIWTKWCKNPSLHFAN